MKPILTDSLLQLKMFHPKFKDCQIHSNEVVHYKFITINLPNIFKDQKNNEERKVEIHKFIKSFDLEKFTYLKTNNYIYIYEFHSENMSEDYNFHIHLLLKNINKKLLPTKSRIIRDISRLYKIKPNFVDVVQGQRPARFEKYCTGCKTEIKNEYVEKDKILRKDLGIKDFFSNYII